MQALGSNQPRRGFWSLLSWGDSYLLYRFMAERNELYGLLPRRNRGFKLWALKLVKLVKPWITRPDEMMLLRSAHINYVHRYRIVLRSPISLRSLF